MAMLVYLCTYGYYHMYSNIILYIILFMHTQCAWLFYILYFLYITYFPKNYMKSTVKGEDSVYMVCRFCTLHVYYTCTCKDWGPCTVVHVHNIIYIMRVHASSSFLTTNKWGSMLTFVPIICTHSINECILSQALLVQL